MSRPFASTFFPPHVAIEVLVFYEGSQTFVRPVVFKHVSCDVYLYLDGHGGSLTLIKLYLYVVFNSRNRKFFSNQSQLPISIPRDKCFDIAY